MQSLDISKVIVEPVVELKTDNEWLDLQQEEAEVNEIIKNKPYPKLAQLMQMKLTSKAEPRSYMRENSPVMNEAQASATNRRRTDYKQRNSSFVGTFDLKTPKKFIDTIPSTQTPLRNLKRT